MKSSIKAPPNWLLQTRLIIPQAARREGLRADYDSVIAAALLLLPILFFARRDDFVGQVGNLRPIVNRPVMWGGQSWPQEPAFQPAPGKLLSVSLQNPAIADIVAIHEANRVDRNWHIGGRKFSSGVSPGAPSQLAAAGIHRTVQWQRSLRLARAAAELKSAR